LEVAVAIAVIGIISGFFITKTIATNKIIRLQTTKNNIEAVAVALASFVANCNRLPRPSDNGDGGESEDPAKFVGRVPFFALGLPAKTALDGNGKPLIYIVEPNLTSSDFSSIYEKNLDAFFCNRAFVPKISVDKVARFECNPIAFVIDTCDNPPTGSDKITVKVSKNTFWLLRDELLMRYLKNSPCKRESAVADGSELL
jgi:hypothetical protein